MEVEIIYEGRTVVFSSILKSKKYYEENKGKFNDKCNDQYKAINGKPFIGNNTWLYKTLNPSGYQDFFDKYLACAKGESLDPKKTYRLWDLKKDEHSGRTLEDLITLAKFYKESCPHVDYPIEDFFDDLVNHIIIETYDGHRAERELRDILISKGCEVEETDGDFDSKFGVDLIVKGRLKQKTYYIQVKPFSAFSKKQPHDGLRKDRINFFNKQRYLDNHLGEHNEIEYMMYNKHHMDETGEILWMCKGDKVRFHLSELTNEKGDTIIYWGDFKSIKL